MTDVPHTEEELKALADDFDGLVNDSMDEDAGRVVVIREFGRGNRTRGGGVKRRGCR